MTFGEMGRYLKDFHKHHFITSRVRPHKSGMSNRIGHVLNPLRCSFMTGICEGQR